MAVEDGEIDENQAYDILEDIGVQEQPMESKPKEK